VHTPNPKEDVFALGDLIRKNDLAAAATGCEQAIAAARAVHVLAYEAAKRHAGILGIDFDNPGDMVALSGGTPKGPAPGGEGDEGGGG
jgi:hypothetical protein